MRQNNPFGILGRLENDGDSNTIISTTILTRTIIISDNRIHSWLCLKHWSQIYVKYVYIFTNECIHRPGSRVVGRRSSTRVSAPPRPCRLPCQPGPSCCASAGGQQCSCKGGIWGRCVWVSRRFQTVQTPEGAVTASGGGRTGRALGGTGLSRMSDRARRRADGTGRGGPRRPHCGWWEQQHGETKSMH